MRNWLKWVFARQEMSTLERYRAALQCADRWLAEFPEAVDALSHVRAWGEGNGGETGHEHIIEKVRERMRLRLVYLRREGDGETEAARDVLAERKRQVAAEGWTPEHDDDYPDHRLAGAAGCYAMYTLAYPAGDPPPSWPWDKEFWKPTTYRRNLVKAGALILADIERLDRAAVAVNLAKGES